MGHQELLENKIMVAGAMSFMTDLHGSQRSVKSCKHQEIALWFFDETTF